VTGVDLSTTAINEAKRLADEERVECTFVVDNLTTLRLPTDHFDFIFDRGCFHGFEVEMRRAVAARIAGWLTPGGLWFSLIGSTDGPPRDSGPPRLSAEAIASAVEPHFEILSLTATEFSASALNPTPPRAWAMLGRKR
jgi:cyclopropane fatty-acyl-phospholipid synthase-like methyltransferase